jgi:MFS family permease
MPRIPSLLLNLAHALDHLFLLIFATAVAAIARDFGLARWEDLMPCATGAFVMFGLGSVPAGRLGDLWGRRRMMLVFYFGIGLSSCAVALTRTPLQITVALGVLGAFSAIYHPVAIPMLLRGALRPGAVIGVNGLAGNLGIALAALSTGLLVQHAGWRAAFVVPGLVSIAAGVAFALTAPPEQAAPARGTGAIGVHLPPALARRTFGVMVASASMGSLLFNVTTNGNTQLLAERFRDIVTDPGTLGMLLALVYSVAACSQVVVGRLIDRVPMKPLFLGIVSTQVLLFALASQASGWGWLLAVTACMVAVFGAIPFNDAMVARYIDDSMRSRVSGMRLAISFSVGSAAVWALGPVVKSGGFDRLQLGLAGVALIATAIVSLLPGEADFAEARRAG